MSLASASTESSLDVPAAAAAAVAAAAAAIANGVAKDAGAQQPTTRSPVTPVLEPADDAASAAPRYPPTPRTPWELLSFFLRCGYRLRTRREASICSFMGIVVVSWKLDCLAALNSGGDRRLLRSPLLELFSEPASALQFLAETFGVEEHGMNLGGRLAAYKNVLGRPASFPSDALRAVANMKKLIGDWICRNLCSLEELTLSSAGAHERGLGTAEISALGARLRSPALVREAPKVGCVVLFDGNESNKTLGPSKLLVN